MEVVNKAIVERYYEVLWNQWNLAVAKEIIAPNIRFRGSLGIDVDGREAFGAYVNLIRGAFPDFHNQIKELAGDENRVAARLVYTGTHRGEIFGIPPSGRQIEYDGAAFFRMEAGLIVDGWVLGDTFHLRQQIEASSP